MIEKRTINKTVVIYAHDYTKATTET